MLARLNQSGYQAYLVGGSVRDLLLGLHPKDFDVATDARPENLRNLFRNCRLIGRRFRLAHIFFGPEIIEVATFRAAHTEEDSVDAVRSETGMIIRDNVYGTLVDDALRRDFSINALYYNIADFSVVDFAGGMEDLKNHVIKMLGDPRTRYHEDPVRMLRAIRFAAKLDFTIHPDTANPIPELAGLLQNVSHSRLFDETLKLFYCGRANKAFELLRHFGLFSTLFPQTESCLAGEHQQSALALITSALQHTDVRVKNGQSLNPAFLFATLLWPALTLRLQHYQHQDMPLYMSLQHAMHDVLDQQHHQISIPRRLTHTLREIWLMQFQLQHRWGKHPYRHFTHPRFRAAYDFLLLRNEAGEDVQELYEWWTQFQVADADDRHKMIKQFERSQPRRKKKK